MKAILHSCLLLSLYGAELHAEDIADLRSQFENGRRLADAGQFAEAEAVFRATIRDAEQKGRSDWAAFALNATALLYEARGRYLDAEKMTQSALRTLERIQGSDSPATAVIGTDLASLYLITGRFSEARSLLQRIVIILENTPGAEPVLVDALTHLGSLYIWTNKVGQAEPLLRRALDIALHGGGNEIQIANCLNDLAFSLLLAKQYPEAMTLSERSMQILDQVANPPAQSRILALRIRAATGFKKQEFSEAESWLQRALAIAENAYGHDHPAIGWVLLEYSVVLDRLHRKEAAKQTRKRAEAILLANLRANGRVYIVDFSELLTR